MTAALVLAAGGWLLAQQPSPTPAATARSQSPMVKGADVRLLHEVRRIADRVEALRDQEFARPPLAVRASVELQAAVVRKRGADPATREHLEARGRAWEDIGLGSVRSPERVYRSLAGDLEGIVLDVDPLRLLVAPRRLSDRDFLPEPDSDDAASMLLLTGVRPDEPLTAHLLMHLRQIERAGSDWIEAASTDELLARAAWAEGEANLVALRYVFSGMDMDGAVIDSGLNPGEFLDGELWPDDLERLAGAEATLLRFVYQDGFGEAADAYRRGGWARLDGEMERRRTTRDVMHPGVRALSAEPWPERPPPGPDLQLADEDTLGEQCIYALISEGTGKDNLALLAADGWTGDRLLRWESSDGGGVTEWITRWASAEEDQEFAYAYGRALAVRFPRNPAHEAGDGASLVQTPDTVLRVERDGRSIRVFVRPRSDGLESRVP